VALITGLTFAGLFLVEIVLNLHGFPGDNLLLSLEGWIIFGHHAVLGSFLIVASCCDLEAYHVPLCVTLPGTVCGLVAAIAWPWPWPWARAMANNPAGPWSERAATVTIGLYPWPFWGPLPDWFQPGGNWQTGLATAIAGALGGLMLARTLRFWLSRRLSEEAMGLGVIDLTMMAGAFIGWQAMMVSFFVAVWPAILIRSLSPKAK